MKIYVNFNIFVNNFYKIVTCRGDLQDWFRVGLLDLLTPYSHNSGLQAIQHYRCSTHFTVHRYTPTKVLSLH
jgi:hypothetical protein